MAKLLFITQKVDLDDDILGVYHRWIKELAKRLDVINVICLYKGRVELPGNVEIFSLGKETGRSRIKYTFRFYKYIWNLRGSYNAVFVHMNPVYIALGGFFWKLYGRKIMLWYNHPMGNLMARVGIFFSDKVFCTSPYSFSAKYKKTEIMPVGIDTDFFKPMPEIQKDNKQILYLGRISPIKKIEYLIEASKLLDSQDLDFRLLIVGSSGSAADREYESKLKRMSAVLLSKSKTEFKSAISNHKTPEFYNSSGIFVNLTPTGSFDKTILESMACGSLVLVSNQTVGDMIPKKYKDFVIFKEQNINDLAAKIAVCIGIPDEEKKSMGGLMRELVLERHSLSRLINKLVNFIEN